VTSRLPDVDDLELELQLDPFRLRWKGPKPRRWLAAITSTRLAVMFSGTRFSPEESNFETVLRLIAAEMPDDEDFGGEAAQFPSTAPLGQSYVPLGDLSAAYAEFAHEPVRRPVARVNAADQELLTPRRLSRMSVTELADLRRKLARLYHPDMAAPDAKASASARMAKINEILDRALAAAARREH
jgi:hypothetical protein